jgi:hypothetical protein
MTGHNLSHLPFSVLATLLRRRVSTPVSTSAGFSCDPESLDMMISRFQISRRTVPSSPTLNLKIRSRLMRLSSGSLYAWRKDKEEPSGGFRRWHLCIPRLTALQNRIAARSVAQVITPAAKRHSPAPSRSCASSPGGRGAHIAGYPCVGVRYTNSSKTPYFQLLDWPYCSTLFSFSLSLSLLMIRLRRRIEAHIQASALGIASFGRHQKRLASGRHHCLVGASRSLTPGLRPHRQGECGQKSHASSSFYHSLH